MQVQVLRGAPRAGSLVRPGAECGRAGAHLHKGIGNVRNVSRRAARAKAGRAHQSVVTAAWRSPKPPGGGSNPPTGARSGEGGGVVSPVSYAGLSGFESRSRNPPGSPAPAGGAGLSAGMHWRAKRSVKACPLGVQVRVLPCRPAAPPEGGSAYPSGQTGKGVRLRSGRSKGVAGSSPASGTTCLCGGMGRHAGLRSRAIQMASRFESWRGHPDTSAATMGSQSRGRGPYCSVVQR